MRGRGSGRRSGRHGRGRSRDDYDRLGGSTDRVAELVDVDDDLGDLGRVGKLAIGDGNLVALG